ncbi:hypothetical protein CLAFUW4_03969 [Fulvia fulva]|uniref:Uncharacterized protein n=1 Tax=Passalora fulva TaxID=5499 RepID=A0A9Q8LEY7_PASFU|nr:uncharacterized protein CLAFUR5_03933 [Fulvia fulva]KAK4626589.1 hypothetical protein CLAFUR4_03955 [Fulvia fulva]KAK4628035.1 hypothetical protein CLAFUR0_03956 [Fulvia fulva]UJO16250.1 hypothetical protein CLAFUR5_03933 [Fulvia fulva]WPV13627.1 hypothetical protein CLAFUW4_03969 [Fulvia fulva]WPV29061.1 hypothetical protein CLAFUW7_03958 [Fulvia fulva]
MSAIRSIVGADLAVQQPTSRLLGLPAELRNKIYQLVLCDPNRRSLLWDEENWCSISHTPAPSLLVTCRQINSESVSYFRFFQHAEFLFASGIKEFLGQASAADKKSVLEMTLLAGDLEEAERMLSLLERFPRLDKITIRWMEYPWFGTADIVIGLEWRRERRSALLRGVASLKKICFDPSEILLNAHFDQRLWAVEVALNAALVERSAQ